jgi:hypothetical protein
MNAIGCLLVALVLSGCAGRATTEAPSREAQRDVAARFAAAVLRGDATGARAFLVGADESTLRFLVDRAAGRWRAQHASIRAPARSAGSRWTFTYAGTRTHRDGRFETERGDLVVFVVPARAGAGVRFFAFDCVRTRFSTHHDALLLPSKR